MRYITRARSRVRTCLLYDNCKLKQFRCNENVDFYFVPFYPRCLDFYLPRYLVIQMAVGIITWCIHCYLKTF